MGKNKTDKRTLKLRTQGRRTLRSLDADELKIVSGGGGGRKFTRACGTEEPPPEPTPAKGG